MSVGQANVNKLMHSVQMGALRPFLELMPSELSREMIREDSCQLSHRTNFLHWYLRGGWHELEFKESEGESQACEGSSTTIQDENAQELKKSERHVMAYEAGSTAGQETLTSDAKHYTTEPRRKAFLLRFTSGGAVELEFAEAAGDRDGLIGRWDPAAPPAAAPRARAPPHRRPPTTRGPLRAALPDVLPAAVARGPGESCLLTQLHAAAGLKSCSPPAQLQ